MGFDYEPFYVGKGSGDRITASLLDSKSTFKMNKINKIRQSGGEIVKMKLFEGLENSVALEKEIEIIKKIGRRDLKVGPLVNQTDGGDGRLMCLHSEESKRKISQTKRGQKIKPYSVRPMTPEQREYLKKINQGENNPFFGKNHTERVKENHSLRVSGLDHPMWGRKHHERTKQKIKERRNAAVDQDKMIQLSRDRNSKAVLQFDLEGLFMKEFFSIKEAAIKSGCSESIIGKCCRGAIKRPRKYIFRFKNTQSLELKNSFLYKINTLFEIDGEEYRLVKRNRSSAIGSKDSTLFTFRKKDHPQLFDKRRLELAF